MGTLRDRLSMFLGDPKDFSLLGLVCLSDVTLVKWLEVKNKSCHGFRAVSKTEEHMLIILPLKVDEPKMLRVAEVESSEQLTQHILFVPGHTLVEYVGSFCG